MLTYEQTKAIENALGADKAGPVIQALETVEERIKASMALELATKRDLKESDATLKRDLKELEVALKHDMKELEVALKRDMKELDDALRHDMKQMEVTLRHDIEELRLATNRDLADTKSEIIKWVAGMLVAQAALIATLVKLL